MEKRRIKKVNAANFLGDQENVFNSVMTFIRQKGPAMGLIQAPAGFGKTWLVGAIIEQLLCDRYGKIGVLAPTGQAVKVCKDNAPYSDVSVRYGTIHSAFAMRPKKDSDKLIFVQDKTKKVWANDCAILFVDEVSQLNDDLFFLLDDYVKLRGGKVVFSGDRFQIPPIGYTFSIPFTKKEASKYGIEVFELTVPIRQKYGNPILDNADLIREFIKRPFIYTDRIDKTNELGESVEYLEVGGFDVKALLKKYFLTSEYKSNTHYVKVLAWRNDTVDKWNSIIRKLLYGGNPDNVEDTRSGRIKKLVVGELLISGKPVIEKDEITGDETVVFGSNEELTVRRFFIDSYDVDGSGAYIIDYYDTVVEFVDDTGVQTSHTIRIVTESAEGVYKKVTKLLYENAARAKKGTQEAALNWKDYWEFIEMFADVNYAYCTTTHKGQGSTYENSIVLEWDIMENPNVFERARILYVAATRPKKNLVQIYKD
jgi:hypothetical protein